MSLRLKLALSGTLLLALSLGLVTSYTLGILGEHFSNQAQSRVLQLRPLLNAALATPLVQRDFASVQAILEESLEDPSLQRLNAFDAMGRPVASAQRTFVADAGDATSHLADFSADLALAGQRIGSVTFTVSRQDLDLAQARITRYVLTVGGLALVFFSALLWFVTGTVTRRLRHLVDASRSIRQGEYAPVLPEPSNDEVGLLVRAFSTMGSEIQRKVDELYSLNDDLEAQVGQRTLDLTHRTIELDRSVKALQIKTYLLNRAPFAVLQLDVGTPDFTILDATDALADVFGHSPSSAVGQPVTWLEPPDSRGTLAGQLRTALASTGSVEWEARIACGSGAARWTRCLAFRLRSETPYDVRLALCLADIHELWQTREDQQRLAGDLQESSKLKSVGLAIAGIAHDLNTPVGVALTGSTKIRDNLEQIMPAPADAPPPAQLTVSTDRLRQIQKASDLVARNLVKAAELIKSLRSTTTHASKTEWHKVGLSPLLESLLVTLSPITHRARCAVHLTCPSDLTFYTEPGALSQAITNLVVNATVHAFEGREERDLRIEVTRLDQQVVIRVADNGAGMSTDAATRAFTPFFTTRREAGGSGLGLFSTRRVVEDVLGGSIAMRTTPGAGTEFSITLPLLDRPPAAAAAAPGTRSAA